MVAMCVRASDCHDSSGPSLQQFDQLTCLLALLVRIAADDRTLDAMTEVILQHLRLDPYKRCAHGLELRQYVDAVPPFFDHARDAANLAFDPVQAGKQFGIGVVLHNLASTNFCIPPPGNVQYTPAG